SRCRAEEFADAFELQQSLQALWPVLERPAPPPAASCGSTPALPAPILSRTAPGSDRLSKPPGGTEETFAAGPPPVCGRPSEVGGYRILQALVSRAGCDVYLARNPCLGDRLIALKVLRHADEDDRDFARLRRVAHEASLLRHPNLVNVSAVGVHRGRAFVVM